MIKSYLRFILLFLGIYGVVLTMPSAEALRGNIIAYIVVGMILGTYVVSGGDI